MDAALFLGRVVPAGANVTITWPTEHKNEHGRAIWGNRAFPSPAEAAGYARWLNNKAQAEVYFALAQFATFTTDAKGHLKTSRHRDNAVGARALVLDLDVRNPHRGKQDGYESLRQAAQHLAQFVVWARLPTPTFVVRSGWGLHVYWISDRVLPTDHWLELGRALAQAARRFGLLFDETPTVNANGVLRVPGCLNRRDPAQPVQVDVIGAQSGDVPYHILHTALQPFMVAPASAGVAQVNRELSAGREVVERPAYMAEIVQRCGVMRGMAAEHGASVPYAPWRLGMIALAAHCADGEAWVHPLSDGYPRYDATVVANWWEQAKAARARGEFKPPTCAWMEANFPAPLSQACLSCPLRGRGKSPIGLGSRTPQQASDEQLPGGFYRDRSGHIWRQLPPDEDGNPQAVKVIEAGIANFRVFEPAPGATYLLAFDVAASANHARTVVLSLDALKMRPANMAEGFLRHNIILPPFNAGHLRDLLMDWTSQLERAKQISRKPPAFGWYVEEGRLAGFSAGGRMFLADGGEQTAIVTDHATMAHYKPRGDLAVWRAVADAFLRSSDISLHAVLAAAFAGPLLKLSGMSGLLLTVMSRDSGTGKSSAMQISQAVWGHPKGAMQALDDTANAVANKLGILNNLPVYWDELRLDDDVGRFVKLAFQLGQGKEKSRLNSDASARAVATWETMLIAASNRSIADKVASVTSKSSDAGLARVFELTVPPQDPSRDFMAMQQQIETLSSHCGVAGQVYAEWLVGHSGEARRAIEATGTMLTQATKARPQHRFWIATMTVLLVGAYIAKRLGLIDFDLAALQAKLVDVFFQMRSLVEEVHQADMPLAGDLEARRLQRVQQALREFCAAHDGATLVTDWLPTGPGRFAKPISVIKQPRHGTDIVAQIGVKSGVLRLRRGALMGWLVANDHPTQDTLKVLQALGAVEHTAVMAPGIPALRTVAQRVLDLKLRAAGLAELAEDEAAP